MKTIHLFLWAGILGLLMVSCTFKQTTSNTKYVNLFMGTSGDNGQLAPGATVPFGVVCVCPDSDPRTHAGYNYEVTKVTGISINRLSGVGCSGGGGNIRIRPLNPSEELHIDKQTEVAVPGYYATSFTNGIQTELTATNLMAVERYVYPENLPASLWIDFTSSFAGKATYQYHQVSSTCLEGYIYAKTVCSHGRYKLYFSLNTDQPFELKEKEDELPCLEFTSSTKEVEIRIGLSALGENEARQEYARWENKSFNRLKKDSYEEWEKQLASVDVKGGTEDDKVIFYTSLYRACLSPVDVTSVDGRYLGTDGQIYSADGFRYYSNWSLWDTYRTKFPLITLFQPQRSQAIMASLAQLYITGKEDWSTPNECVPTVRTEHAIATLLDAYRKKVLTKDVLQKAYPGMVAEAKRLSLKSPDQCLEAASDFWALSELSKELGKQADYKKWKQRGEELFDSIWPREFMKIDANYTKMRGNGLYQGTRWQYRWGAPMFLDRMIALCGKDKLQKELNTFFDEQLYNQGNEPDIHVPFLFGRLGQPLRTGGVVQELMLDSITHRYGGNDAYKTPFIGHAFKNAPRGYCPEMDEDDGTMSAWFVFASMGMYPLIVGEPVYELFSPVFDRIEMQMDEAAKVKTVIRTAGRKDMRQPLRRVTWNGTPLPNFQIKHAQLAKGGELVFWY